MSNEQCPYDDRIDAYLDGTMSSDEQQQFELVLTQDSQLQSVVETGRAINVSLRESLAPPPLPSWIQDITSRGTSANGTANGTTNGAAHAAIAQPLALTGTEPDTPASTGRTLRMSRWFALAAAVALLISGALLTVFALGIGNGGYDATQFRTLAQAYTDIDEPQWICESDAEFAGTFVGRFNTPILFDSDAPDASVSGLAYCHTLTRDTVCLVGEASGAKVLVLVDRLERDPRPNLPADSDLNLFRRELGSLVLYEISPNSQAMLLDWIYRLED